MAIEELTDSDAISVFNSALPVAQKLERARTELLDLSARNRLLNIPQSARAARSLEVIASQRRDLVSRRWTQARIGLC